MNKQKKERKKERQKKEKKNKYISFTAKDVNKIKFCNERDSMNPMKTNLTNSRRPNQQTKYIFKKNLKGI